MRDSRINAALGWQVCAYMRIYMRICTCACKRTDVYAHAHMCVNVYAYMRACVCVYAHTRIPLHVQWERHAYTRICTYAHTYVRIYARICAYTHVRTHAYMHACMHIRIYPYTHIPIYPYMHIRIQGESTRAIALCTKPLLISYAQMHIHIYAYTHIRMYAYTHTGGEQEGDGAAHPATCHWSYRSRQNARPSMTCLVIGA